MITSTNAINVILVVLVLSIVYYLEKWMYLNTLIIINATIVHLYITQKYFRCQRGVFFVSKIFYTYTSFSPKSLFAWKPITQNLLKTV